MPSKFLKVLSWIVLTNALITFVVTMGPILVPFLPLDLQLYGPPSLINSVIMFFILIPYSCYKAVKSRRTDVLLFSIGFFIFSAAIIVDFINVLLSLHWPWVAMWGGSMFSLILAKNNSLMFAKTYARSEQLNKDLQIKNEEVAKLNKNLEKKVEERTEEVRALLEYIPQGILSVGEDGIVEPNYSAQLPEILGTDQIAGRSFLELVLENSRMSADDRDQAWQSIFACVGESYFNFEINEDKLPLQLHYIKGDETVTLKLTWNIATDENDEIQHILVTMLDVSQEIEAKRALDEKNKDFEVIKQLVEAGPKKAAQFFGSGKMLIDENEHLILSGHINEESLKILFVNAHTFKGAARTLQFKMLSDLLHRVESKYGQMMRHEAEITQEELLNDIREARQEFNRYLTVNKEILGRSEDFSKVAIDREFLEKNFRLFQYLEHNDNLPSDIREIIHNNSDELVHLIFMSMPAVLEEVLEQSSKIAKDLEKEPPKIDLDCAEIMINHKQDQVLRNILVHLLRNSLDHGIESARERESKMKERFGTIHLQVTETDNDINIVLYDDGRGLAIERLKGMGEKAGLLQEGASNEDIAELIFNQGLSTSKKVSQISGRGVGMDAVRRFLEAEGGSIKVELGDPVDPQGRFYNFRFLIQMPLIKSQELQEAS